MTVPDFRAEVARADAELDAAWAGLLRTLLRNTPAPDCGDTVPATSRDPRRVCCEPVTHRGVTNHRDAYGWTWGDTDA
jgi:hypothetical protein